MGCNAPTIIVGGVILSTSDFVNAKELLKVSGDMGDPTGDAYDENIARGNNTSGTTGIQFPPPTQTTLPPPIDQRSKESDDKAPPGGNGAPVSCTAWAGDYDFQLSQNFKVRDFSITALYKNQITDFSQGANSIDKSTRVCNLQGLAVNVAEPLLAKFGRFSINSGIRNTNSTSSGLSQHVTGQAMDVQFPGWSYSRYWENAAWVKDNIPYDQFIYEHSSSTGLAWYHLSFNRAGNRAASIRTKVMTMYKNQYSPGLHRYG